MTKPVITPELKAAVKTVLLARAYAETIRPTIEGIKQTILDNNVYMIAEHWVNHPSGHTTPAARITEAKHAYLMEEYQAQQYYALLNAEYIKAGFELPGFGYCPLLMAESNEREALRVMVDASAYIAASQGLSAEDLERMYYKLEWLKTYQEAIIGLVISLLDKTELADLHNIAA